MPPEAPAWYCLRSKTKSEHLAAAQLAVLPDVEVFCPRLRFRRNTRRGRVWFIEALFPGYFFARFNARVLSRTVIHSPGVTGMVTFGDQCIPIPDQDIEVLKTLMDEKGIREISDSLQEVSETEVVAGPFRGLQVVVTKVLSARERVRILLEFLGGWREVEVDAAHLASPKPAPKGLEK
jgi:transcriptional antiterminator RfaH